MRGCFESAEGAQRQLDEVDRMLAKSDAFEGKGQRAANPDGPDAAVLAARNSRRDELLKVIKDGHSLTRGIIAQLCFAAMGVFESLFRANRDSRVATDFSNEIAHSRHSLRAFISALPNGSAAIQALGFGAETPSQGQRWRRLGV
jgi:hypothetical protein